MNAIDLDKLEETTYASRWDDGLLDLFAGVSVLVLGVMWLIPGAAAFGGFAPVLLIPIWPAVRKRVTEPRVGYVEFGAARKGRERRVQLALFLAGTAALFLGVAAYFIANGDGWRSEDWVAMVIPALPGVLLGFGGVMAGFMADLDRLMGYGLLMAALAAVFTYYGAEPGVYLAVGGVMVTVFGVVRLVRFLKNHPVPTEVGS